MPMSSPILLAMRWEARQPWKASGPGTPGARSSVPRGCLRYGGSDFSDGQSYGWLNSSYLADPDPLGRRVAGSGGIAEPSRGRRPPSASSRPPPFPRSAGHANQIAPCYLGQPCPTTRRPTWPDQPACRDYVIQREDLRIGRVQLTKLPGGDRFVWSIYVNNHVPKIPGVPISGSAATLDNSLAEGSSKIKKECGLHFRRARSRWLPKQSRT